MISSKSSTEWPSPKDLELLKKQRIQASIGKPVVAFGHILYYFVVDLVLEPYAQRIGSWLTADVLRRRFCLCEPTLTKSYGKISQGTAGKVGQCPTLAICPGADPVQF